MGGEMNMLEAIRRLSTATGNLHRDAKESADTIGTFLVDAFHFLALFVIGATTVWSAATAFMGMVLQGRATLGDILLLFIYLEIGAMVGVYFKTTRLPVRYLIYICNYCSRPRADRNSRCRASNRYGYTSYIGRNSSSIIRCPGA